MSYIPDKTMAKILNEAKEEFKGKAEIEQIKEAFIIYWELAAEMTDIVSLPTISGLMKFGKFHTSPRRVAMRIEMLERYLERMSFDDPNMRYISGVVNDLRRVIERIIIEKETISKHQKKRTASCKKKTLN